MINKKSQLTLKALIVTIISALVVFSFIMAGKSYAKQELYFKAAVARDVALMIDTLYDMPGDVNFIYPIDLTNYGIRISGNEVRVYRGELGPLDVTASSYRFFGVNKKIDVKLDKAKRIKFEKKGENILISRYE